MRLASVTGAFQNLIELVFSVLYYEVDLVYLDDIRVCGIAFDELLLRLGQVFA